VLPLQFCPVLPWHNTIAGQLLRVAAHSVYGYVHPLWAMLAVFHIKNVMIKLIITELLRQVLSIAVNFQEVCCQSVAFFSQTSCCI
jgi:hypothetical protein